MRRLLLIAAAALATSSMAVLPAFGADTGTVPARVTVAAPCITVGPSAGVDFGTATFNATASQGAPLFAGSPSISVTSCAVANEILYVRGTDATSSTSSARWSLAGCCTPAHDVYEVRVASNPGPPSNTVPLILSNRIFRNEVPGSTESLTAKLQMPLAGSSGVGQTMNMQIVFTATF